MTREVVCATKNPDGPDDCRCITEIGYVILDKRRTKTPKQVHEDIKDGKDYYVEYGGERTDLIAVEREGTKYVRTEPNDTDDDNLLKIGDC